MQRTQSPPPPGPGGHTRRPGQTGHSPLLVRLARLNPTGVFLAALALVLVGLFAPGIIGGSLLLCLVGGLAVLLVKTWPVQTPTTRAIRLVALTLLFTTALLKIL